MTFAPLRILVRLRVLRDSVSRGDCCRDSFRPMLSTADTPRPCTSDTPNSCQGPFACATSTSACSVEVRPSSTAAPSSGSGSATADPVRKGAADSVARLPALRQRSCSSPTNLPATMRALESPASCSRNDGPGCPRSRTDGTGSALDPRTRRAARSRADATHTVTSRPRSQRPGDAAYALDDNTIRFNAACRAISRFRRVSLCTCAVRPGNHEPVSIQGRCHRPVPRDAAEGTRASSPPHRFSLPGLGVGTSTQLLDDAPETIEFRTLEHSAQRHEPLSRSSGVHSCRSSDANAAPAQARSSCRVAATSHGHSSGTPDRSARRRARCRSRSGGRSNSKKRSIRDDGSFATERRLADPDGTGARHP